MHLAVWAYLRRRYRKLRRRLINAVCSTLYRDSHPDIQRSIMVAGAARSGTTWLAELIASQVSGRIMFEPFHPRQVDAYRRFSYFQYMRPDEQDQELWRYCHRVFTGDIRNQWIDHRATRIFPQYRVVKDIRANLFLRWLNLSFPEVPMLFIMRHPCAVVSSRLQLGWWTDQDIAPILSQEKLIDDFLADKMEIISRARTDEEKHTIVWCVNNLVPIKQFSSSPLNVVFYENLCAQPHHEIPRIFHTVGCEYDDTVFGSVQRPSTSATLFSAVVTGEDKLARWTKELSPTQIDTILSIVEDFGLSHIYDESVRPLVTKLSTTT